MDGAIELQGTVLMSRSQERQEGYDTSSTAEGWMEERKKTSSPKDFTRLFEQGSPKPTGWEGPFLRSSQGCGIPPSHLRSGGNHNP